MSNHLAKKNNNNNFLAILVYYQSHILIKLLNHVKVIKIVQALIL